MVKDRVLAEQVMGTSGAVYDPKAYSNGRVGYLKKTDKATEYILVDRKR
jgi:hypothetical protein